MKYKIIVIFIFVIGKLIALDFIGKVETIDGIPIDNVIIKSNNKIEISNDRGYFRIKNVAKDDTVFFYKMGYESKKMLFGEVKKVTHLRRKVITLVGMKISGKRDYSNNYEVIKVTKSDRARYEDLGNLLNTKGELQIKGKNLVGEKKSISIGGNLAKHTIVTLDGIVLNSSGEEFDLSQIPIDVIEKVEIVKNNAGAVAGSGGIGGVINIVTKHRKVEKLGLSQAIKTGSFGMKSFSQYLNAAKGKVSIFLKSESAQNDFKYRYILSDEKPILKRKNNAKKNKIADLKLFFNNELMNANLKFSYNNFYKQLPGSIDKMPMFDRAHMTGYNLKSIFSVDKNLNDFLIGGKIYYIADNSKYTNTESSNPLYYSQSRTNDAKAGAKLNGVFENDFFNLKFHQELKREEFYFTDYLNSQNSIQNVHIDQISSYGNASVHYYYNNFSFNPDFYFRYDHIKGSDKNENYKSYRSEIKIDYDSTFHAEILFRAGTSYSLPSFYETYWKGDMQTQGNKDLKPEKSRGYGFDSKISANGYSLSLSFDENRVTNLIYWYKSVVAWKPGNIADANLKTFIVSYKKESKFVDTSVSYTKIIALDKTLNQNGTHSIFYDKNIINIADYKLSIQNRINVKSFSLGTEYLEMGKRWITRDNLWGYLKPYFIVNGDVSVFKQISKKFDIRFDLKLNNIFDSVYEEYQLMPNAGFNWQMGINFNYKK